VDQHTQGDVILIQDRHNLIGRRHLGESREAAHVTKDDRDLAAMAFKKLFAAGGFNHFGKLRRKKSTHAGHASTRQEFYLNIFSKYFCSLPSSYAAASVGGSGGPVLGALVTPVALIGPARST
jgi:hypothetical protein